MPSFIFQLASTALAFAALQIPSATAAPVDVKVLDMHRSLDAEALDAQSHIAAASTVEVRQFHNVYPVMRTMSRDEYYFSTVSLDHLRSFVYASIPYLHPSTCSDAKQPALSCYCPVNLRCQIGAKGFGCCVG
jgi:hypothetical protein